MLFLFIFINERNNFSKKSGVKDDGAIALGTALESNKSIKVLILETNHISGDAIKTLLQSLSKNSTLEGTVIINIECFICLVKYCACVYFNIHKLLTFRVINEVDIYVITCKFVFRRGIVAPHIVY